MANLETTSEKDITYTLAEISKNSTLKNANRQFLTFKYNAQKRNLNFKSDNFRSYNRPFT